MLNFNKLKQNFSHHKLIWVLLFSLTLFYILITFNSVQRQSATVDEKFHFTRGIMLLETGDYRINQHHPILFNVLGALPTYLGFNEVEAVLPETENNVNWDQARKDELSFEIVELNGGLIPFTRDILQSSRYMMIFINALFIPIYFYINKRILIDTGAEGYVFGEEESHSSKSITGLENDSRKYEQLNVTGKNRFLANSAALISTVLLVLSPTYLAHSPLVTTDVGSAITIFSVTAFLTILFRKVNNGGKISYKHWLILAFLIFAALISKYTAVSLLPLWFLAVWYLELISGRAISEMSISEIKTSEIGKSEMEKSEVKTSEMKRSDVKSSLAKSFLKSISFFLMVYLLIFIVYGAQFGTLEEVMYNHPTRVEAINEVYTQVENRFSDNSAQLSITKFIIEDLKLPAPHYINGFIDNVLVHNYTGHDSFLLGESSESGWKSYFYIAFGLKENLVVVTLTIFSLLYQFTKIFRTSRNSLLKNPYIFFILTPIYIMLLSTFSSLNLGVRHILPVLFFIYPFISHMLVSIIFNLNRIHTAEYRAAQSDYKLAQLSPDSTKKSTHTSFLNMAESIDKKEIQSMQVTEGSPKFLFVSIIITTAIILFNFVTTVNQHPNYIGFFNEIAGDPDKADRYLQGSNYDWGQNEWVAYDYMVNRFGYTEDRTAYFQSGEYILVGKRNLDKESERKFHPILEQIYQDYTDGDLQPETQIEGTHLLFKVVRQ